MASHRPGCPGATPPAASYHHRLIQMDSRYQDLPRSGLQRPFRTDRYRYASRFLLSSYSLTTIVGAVFISTLAVEVIHEDKHPKTEQIILLENVIQPIVAFMVLCSVAIHGLSIPGFSLGRRVRTVSRTWSRHALVPDWATQLKIVDRGADIVINRDSVMEQGGLSRKGTESGTLTLSPSERRAEGEMTYDVESPVEKAEGRPEREIVTAWQEPHHTILERQRSPPDDVRDLSSIIFCANLLCISRSRSRLSRKADQIPQRSPPESGVPFTFWNA